MIGPGKYDSILTETLKQTKGTVGILIVLNGEHGPGFCAQLSIEALITMPIMLRSIADQIEVDYKKGEL